MKTSANTMRLLIIEDDERLAQLLERGFAEEGFETVRACDGENGLELAVGGGFDCVLLDVMLPKKDGLAVCRALRERGVNSPVLMLTVKGTTEDKVQGLSAGADDYVVKPFSFEELLARIHAQVRRHQSYAGRVLRFADLELDLIERTARRAGATIDLTPKEFDLLEYLLRHRGRVLGERELLENVWDLSFDPRTNVVNVYMYHLRTKVDRGYERKLIHTLRGQGWRLGEEKT